MAEKLITKSFERLLDKGKHRGFITYEELLLKLAANFLGRTMVLVPLLEGDSKSSFKPSLQTELTKKYHIACCNELHIYNFFLSVFKTTTRDTSAFQKQTNKVEKHLNEDTKISCFSFCWKRQRSDLYKLLKLQKNITIIELFYYKIIALVKMKNVFSFYFIYRRSSAVLSIKMIIFLLP